LASADVAVAFAKLQTGRSLLEYQAQAKQLFRRMNSNTPTRGSLETGSYLFQFVFVQFTHTNKHIVIYDNTVCCLE